MGEKGAIVDAFVDRIEELAALEEQFADHQAAMAVIYGRRRIGKTALITEFVRDKRALYFLATEESEEQNRAAFQKQVARVHGRRAARPGVRRQLGRSLRPSDERRRAPRRRAGRVPVPRQGEPGVPLRLPAHLGHDAFQAQRDGHPVRLAHLAHGKPGALL